VNKSSTWGCHLLTHFTKSVKCNMLRRCNISISFPHRSFTLKVSTCMICAFVKQTEPLISSIKSLSTSSDLMISKRLFFNNLCCLESSGQQSPYCPRSVAQINRDRITVAYHECTVNRKLNNIPCPRFAQLTPVRCICKGGSETSYYWSPDASGSWSSA